jgi:hypothetical protein
VSRRRRESLTPSQQRAAILLGRGNSVQATAADCHVTRRTVSTWRRREDFQELERGAREETFREPTVRGTLEAALGATDKHGHPDWATRVAAARTLLANPAPGDDNHEPEVPVIVFESPRRAESCQPWQRHFRTISTPLVCRGFFRSDNTEGSPA